MLLTASWMLLAIPSAFSQSDIKLPQFEVASVKPANPKGAGGFGLYTYPGGKVVASQCTVQYLLMEAFKIKPFQISGAPGWTKDERYDIEAKPPASSASIHSDPASFKSPMNEEQRQMLQALLIDRFHLQFHRETKQAPSFVLEKTGKPLKLQSPKDKNDYPWAGSPEGGAVAFGTGLAGRNISMPELAVRLSGFMGRPVVDQTGLQGSFDFEYKTGDDDPGIDATSTIVTSLQPLGLRLRSTFSPVENIVVDQIERPSQN